MNRDERVSGVVLTREQGVFAEPVELTLDRLKVLVELAGEVAVEREKLFCILIVADEPLVALEALRQAGVLGGDVGGPPLVVPEARLTHDLLELGEPWCDRLGVKGNHGPRPTGSRSPRGALRRTVSFPPSR